MNFSKFLLFNFFFLFSINLTFGCQKVDTIKDFIAQTVTDTDGNVTATADKIKILKNVNGESIATASAVDSRVRSTPDGALIELGEGHSILLEGVDGELLTADNFIVVDVL